MFKGFHLIEILIVLSIISILTMLSVPLYSQHLLQGGRLEAETLLTKLALDMEEYHLEHGSYREATLAKLNFTVSQKYYRFAISQATESNFLLIATPLQQQTSDICGTLSLNAIGEKSISGKGKLTDCW